MCIPCGPVGPISPCGPVGPVAPWGPVAPEPEPDVSLQH